MNERDFPHLVELELPPGGLPSQNLEFDAFHQRFGGTRLTYSPFKPGRPTGPRARYQRSY
jgi:hypothetical protein